MERSCAEYVYAIHNEFGITYDAFALRGSDLAVYLRVEATANVTAAVNQVADARAAAGLAPLDESEVISSRVLMDMAVERAMSAQDESVVRAALLDFSKATIAHHEAIYAALCSAGE